MLLGDMADGVGVSSPFLSAIETGKKPIPRDLPAKIATFLGLAENDAAELQQLADQSSKSCSIDLDLNPDGRDVAIAFARKFANLSDEQLKEMKRMLEGW